MISFKNGIIVMLLVSAVADIKAAEGSANDEFDEKDVIEFDEKNVIRFFKTDSQGKIKQYMEEYPEEMKKMNLVHQAAYYNVFNILKWLIEEKKLELTYFDGLHPFCAARSIKVVDYFLDHLNCDINMLDDFGDTILHYVSYEIKRDKMLDLISHLVSRGACHDIKNKEGQTPRDIASSQIRDSFARKGNLKSYADDFDNAVAKGKGELSKRARTTED